MRYLILFVTGLLVLGVLAVGVFTAVRLLADPDGAAVNAASFADPNGNVSVRVSTDPAPELPGRASDAAGIIVRRADNSIFVGTGTVTISTESVNGVASLATEHSGPEIEVVMKRDTLFYRDVTDYNGGLGSGESGEVRVQQRVQPVAAPAEFEDMTFVQVWGERRGERIVADALVYRNR